MFFISNCSPSRRTFDHGGGSESSAFLVDRTACLLVRLGSHPGKGQGFVTGETGNCAQDWNLMLLSPFSALPA